MIFCIPCLLCGPAASDWDVSWEGDGKKDQMIKDNKPETCQGELPALTMGECTGEDWVKPLSLLPTTESSNSPQNPNSKWSLLSKVQLEEMVTPFTLSSLHKLLTWHSGINPKLSWDNSSPIFHKLWGICMWDTVKSVTNGISNYLEATFPMPPPFLVVPVNSAVLCSAGGSCREPVEELPVRDPHCTQIS